MNSAFSPTAALVALSMGTASLPVLAEDVHYNQVSLRAEVSKNVAHDLMSVTLYTEAQNADPTELASQITKTLNAALAKARQVKGVTIQPGRRNSSPVYDDKGQKITAWREHAELRLESADFPALAKLASELLGDLKMGDMTFTMAQATRQASEDSLFKDAVAAFKARAQLTAEALGGTGYKIVNLNLNSAGYSQPVLRGAKMLAMSNSAPVPEVEAGSSQVSITAEGVIEVQMP